MAGTIRSTVVVLIRPEEVALTAPMPDGPIMSAR
jgi:hypothetical protein